MIVMPALPAMEAARVVGTDIVATTGTPALASFVAIEPETLPVSSTWQSSRRRPSCSAAPINLSITQCRLTSSRTVRTWPSKTSAPVWIPPVLSRRCPAVNIAANRGLNWSGSANLLTNSALTRAGSETMGTESVDGRNSEYSILTVTPSTWMGMRSIRSPASIRPSPISQPTARSSRCSGVHSHRVTRDSSQWKSTSTSGASGASMLCPQK